MKTILIFGGRSSISQNIIQFIEKNYKLNIIKTSSNNDNDLIYFNIDNEESYDNLNNCQNIDYILWCQGYNVNDSILSMNKEDCYKSLNINTNYIILSLNHLLKNNKINNNARLCIISSIWQQSSKKNKLSYSVSKSAISGIIKSVSCDLKDKNILINAILPGPILNEMTYKTLTKNQVNEIKDKLGYDRLIDINDICYLFDYLCFKNNSTTGQSIVIDLGLTNLC